MRLVAHVLFAAKSSTVGDQFDSYLLIGQSKQLCNVVAVVPNTLTT